MTPFTLQWKIRLEEENQLVRDFLKTQSISKRALTDIKFEGGAILVNNQPITVRYLLKKDDVLTVVFPTEKTDIKPEKINIDIVYEDDFLLVLNKEPFMPSIPSREHPSGSLANALAYYYQTIGLESTVHLVNRLDRDTSGLLAVAKHRYVHHLLGRQQLENKINRRYEAIVEGEFTKKEGVINAPIGRKDTSIIEREVRTDGKRAVTNFNVINSFFDLTHLSLQLETGRTHQIRVHLSHIGHPLVGDDLYGGSKQLINRQALHCCELTLWHPVAQQRMVFHSDLPDDMQRLLL